MRNVPCKDCKDRKPACHDTCEAYKNCVKEYKEGRKQLNNDTATESALWNIKRRRMMK